MRYSQVSAYSAAAVHCKRSQLSTGWTAACIGARAGGSLYPPHPDSCLHQQENPPKSQVPFWGGLSVGLAQSWTIRQEDRHSAVCPQAALVCTSFGWPAEAAPGLCQWPCQITPIGYQRSTNPEKLFVVISSFEII